MDYKNEEKLRKLKPISLKDLENINERNKIPLSQSTNMKMLNKLGLCLSPNNQSTKNKQKNILLKSHLNERAKTFKKTKLTKNQNNILPNLSNSKDQSDTSNDIIVNSISYPKILQNKIFKNPEYYFKNKNSKQKIKVEQTTNTYLIDYSTGMSENFNLISINNKNANKNNSNNNKIFKDIKIDEKKYNFTGNDFYKSPKTKRIYSPPSNSINFDSMIGNGKTSLDNILAYNKGVFCLNDFNRKLLNKNKKFMKGKSNIYLTNDSKRETLNKLKNHNLFSEIKKENDEMKKKIKEEYDAFENMKKKYYLKRPNEETYKGYSKLFYKFNKEREKNQDIITNRLIKLNWAGDNGLENIDYKEKIDYMNRTKFDNILLNSKGRQIYNEDTMNKKKKLSDRELVDFTNRANRKVEKIFPDLIGFNLPKIFRDNKAYTIKLLYDVFIEFKTLLKFCILYNQDINIHKKGIDFQTFFNCNTKINQQGEGLSKKIFRALNNKTEKKYLPWGNYLDGMMRMKDPIMNNKMDLFFEILDENGDGSLDYNEVYNLSLVSLQRTLPQNPLDILKKSEEEKQNEKEVIDVLAVFFSNMIFDLVNIDVKDDIPIDVLRKKMQEGGEAAEYLEMFLCADNFA
jgi:hypothetical protein